jgi:hypothetical protein
MTLKIPAIHGLIERRILVNYRVDTAALAKTLPSPFRPQLVGGFGIAGICLIRLKHIRPRHLPPWLGISSENAAHRVAVEWDENGEQRQGVFVRRRDTNSRLNSLAGGRVFPGVHHHAQFHVHESNERFEINVHSDDGQTNISLRAAVSNKLPSASIFSSLDSVSDFFQGGSLGYSATSNSRRFQGLELHCRQWQMEPLEVEEVRSSYFQDDTVFPPGSIQFDSALLMHEIEHEWHGKADLCCEETTIMTGRGLASH